jgi:diguanylate cyclase (GGDEF)-like protein/PAS domain S-box-containing protein
MSVPTGGGGDGLVKPLTQRAWQIYILLGVTLTLIYYFVPALKGNGVLFNVIGISSAIAIVVGIRLHKPACRLAWNLFALGQILFVSGDAFYYGYSALSDSDVPFPSVGDFFYLSVYPALIAGLLALIHRRNPDGDRPSLIDALIVTTGVGLLAWVFLMAPYAHDASLPLVQKIVLIAYPAMDVCLLAVAVRLSVDSAERRPALYLLGISALSLLAADAALGIVSLEAPYVEGGILDAGWAAYYVFWGAAALHPSMRMLERPAPFRSTSVSRSRMLLLTGASLIAPAVQAIQLLRGEPIELPVMIGGSAVLFLLVVARMSGLLREHERSAKRERGLREAGGALVAASTREEVYEAALDAMLALAEEQQHALLALFSDSGKLCIVAAQRSDSSRTLEDWVLLESEVDDLFWPGGEGRRVQRLDSTRARTVLKLPEDVTHVTAFPLFLRETVLGFVFVAGGSDLARTSSDALRTLAANVALSLESVGLAEDLHRRRSEARFGSLVQHSSDLITVIEADSTITYQSPAVERVLGYGRNELVGTKLVALMDAHEAKSLLNLLSEGDTSSPQAAECRLLHSNQTWIHFEVLSTNLLADPNVEGIVLNARDISERKALEKQLTHQAFHDDVTGLANRALFTDRVNHGLARQVRDSMGLAALFVDLDDFKTINDSLGHACGDEVLRIVARRLQDSVRPMDTVARFGGDEFAILLEDVERPDYVAEVADRILAALATTFTVEDRELFVSASIGIAILEGTEAMTTQADDVMRNADVAMYLAKRDGKGAYRVFEPSMHEDVLDRLQLKGELQRAIEQHQLDLNFQPIVGLDDGLVNGVEALVRWHHPERGLLGPDQFISLAEETGLIVPLGRWVLREACSRARLLQVRRPDMASLGMSVNLSAKQLQQPDLIDDVKKALSDSGLEARCLTLEITESMLMNDTDSTIAKLNALKDLGVKLAVDDFGTGYSSLSYLSRFPVDILKIDRSFINRVNEGIEESALAAAIVKLSEALDLHTVAEGIEMSGQMQRLVELGCASGQGFLFAKPMAIDALLTWLETAEGRSPVTAPGI